jgi:hypothetical protein
MNAFLHDTNSLLSVLILVTVGMGIGIIAGLEKIAAVIIYHSPEQTQRRMNPTSNDY